MMRAVIKVCLLATFIVGMSVIWQGDCRAATVSIEPLGQLADDLVIASRLDVDASGNVYVLSARRRTVTKFDRGGAKVATIDVPFANGAGLAVVPDGSRLYVSAKDQVAVVDTATGNVLSYLGGAIFRFLGVADLDLDDQGYVYVADGQACIVRVFNPAGTQVDAFGAKGAGAGTFEAISGILVDSARQRVYVSDPVYINVSTPEVQVFNLGGTYIQTFPGPTGFGTAKMDYFAGMTVDHLGRLYVFNSSSSELYIYEVGADGAALVQTGSYAVKGFAPGQILGPKDSAYDPDTQRLFVACGDGRVEYFGIDGGSNPSANTPPSAPVAVSPSGESVVSAATPQFKFENASDVDASNTLSYQLAVYQADALVAELADVPGDASGITSVALAASYQEDARHTWAVRAFDGSAYSPWSEAQAFFYSQVNAAPTAPGLIAPLTVATVLDGSGKLVWSASTDSDPGDTLSYTVELSTDPAFTGGVAQSVAGTEVTLGALDKYADLVVGAPYYWRVAATDSAGASAISEVGEFVYDTSVLRVTSNMPGTRIYLGGDHAYPGVYVDVAPLELRDFAPGLTTVVAERGGFEPFVVPVEMGLNGKVDVAVSLIPAIAPEDFKARPVEAAGLKVARLEATAPALSDLDNDGVLDLLVVDAGGLASVFAGSLDADGALVFAAAQDQQLAGSFSGATPFAVDWNNDGLKDLLIGGDNTLALYLADGPASWGAPISFQSVVNQLPVATGIVPVVVDDNGDGVKDLLVGSAGGNVYLFLNKGSDESPDFSSQDLLVPLLRSSFGTEVAPLLVDWNADGQRDLLVATQGAVYLCSLQPDGKYVPVQMLTVTNLAARKTGGKGKAAAESSALMLGDRPRCTVADVDGVAGKDLLVGNAAGELNLVVSHGQQDTQAFRDALVEKLDEIDQSAAGVAGFSTALDDVATYLAEGKDAQAAARAEALLVDFAVSADVAALVGELVELID